MVEYKFFSFLSSLEFLHGFCNTTPSTAFTSLDEDQFLPISHLEETLAPNSISFYLSHRSHVGFITWVSKNVLSASYSVLLPRFCFLNFPLPFPCEHAVSFSLLASELPSSRSSGMEVKGSPTIHSTNISSSFGVLSVPQMRDNIASRDSCHQYQVSFPKAWLC